MSHELERAREDVQRAGDLAENETVREQLRSIDEGLKEMTHSSKEDASDTDERETDGDATTEGDRPRGDQLQQVEATLAGLEDDAVGRAGSLIRDARDEIDEYRRRRTRDW